ncbi:MAG: 2-C-methyl-D-erythritol 4-phosphate cytidylyltransferase [Treponema sp.]|nr:2-C-methyl-D-erythritol 4-phosphate cytidylyltransferase [Treponema sp.]
MTTHSNPKIAVIITAAGSSTRMGGTQKKEYLPLKEGTVLSACVKAFETASKIIITIPAGDEQQALKAINPTDELNSKLEFVTGGTTRQKSILNALEHIKKSAEQPQYILIHDGARPFVSQEVIQNVIAGTIQYEAAAPGIKPTDTIKQINSEGFIVKHLERSLLTAIQTPQGFVFEKLYEAHKKAAKDDYEYTDDSEIWGKYAGPVKLVEGDVNNKKITYPGDLEKGAAK